MSDRVVVDLSSVTMEDLEKLRKRNIQKLQSIGQQGAAVDPTNVIGIRLDTFLDLFLDDAQRIQFEFAFETRMSESLDKVLSQLRAASLTQGVAVPSTSKLLIPGR